MAAGDSAHAEAERVRQKIETLQRYLYNQERGAEGERRTAEALQGLGPSWVVLHDVRWPGRWRANIDHVVIGPGGIFVIDSKNWFGNVTVTNGVLRQNGYSREKNIAGAADGALAIAELVGAAANLVQPVLCFVEQPDMHGFVREVALCSPQNIVAMLQSRPPVLTPADVLELATRLDAQLSAATTPGQGYRPADYPAPRPVRRPHPPQSASSQPAGWPAHQAPTRSRRGLYVGLIIAAAVFLLVPMVGVVGVVITSIVDSATPARSCSISSSAEARESGKRVARDAPRRRSPNTRAARSGAPDC